MGAVFLASVHDHETEQIKALAFIHTFLFISVVCSKGPLL